MVKTDLEKSLQEINLVLNNLQKSITALTTVISKTQLSTSSTKKDTNYQIVENSEKTFGEGGKLLPGHGRLVPKQVRVYKDGEVYQVYPSYKKCVKELHISWKTFYNYLDKNSRTINLNSLQDDGFSNKIREENKSLFNLTK